MNLFNVSLYQALERRLANLLMTVAVCLTAGAQAEAATSFADVGADSWALTYINAIADAGITTGCSSANYCPANPVTRAQMAAFLIRAKAGEPPANYCAGAAPFLDTPATTWSCDYTKWLSELAITTGCGNGNYCPNQYVNRQQMAAFIVRAMEGEPAAGYCDSGSPFADVPATNPMCKYVKRLAELGVTTGCGGGNYCPNNLVTRAQMAVFLARAFLGVGDGNAWRLPLTLVEASASGTQSITASWLPVGDSATLEANIIYHVHLGNTADFVPDGSTQVAQGAGALSAQITGLMTDMPYYVRIQAVGPLGQQTTSNSLPVRTLAIEPVTNPAATITVYHAGDIVQTAPNTFLLTVGRVAPAVGGLITSTDQGGFLKKVVALTDVGGQVQIDTVAAGLHEAFQDIDLGGSIALASVPASAARALARSARVDRLAGGNITMSWPASGFSLVSPPAQPAAPQASPLPAELDGKLRTALRTSAELFSETSVRKTSKGEWVSVVGPGGVAVVPGNSGTIQIKLKVDRDDHTWIGDDRIPIAICKVADLAVDAPSGKSGAGLATMGTLEPTVWERDSLYGGDYYPATRTATLPIQISAAASQVSEQPYTVSFVAYVDEAGNGCADATRPLLVPWKEKVYFEFPVYVANEPNFPSGETSNLSFQGGFKVDNKVTFTFAPQIKQEVNIRGNQVKKARIVAKTNVLLDQKLTVTASGTANLDVTRNFIPERTFIKVFMAGSVPVVMTGSFAADIRVQGNTTGALVASESLLMGFNDLEYGVEYVNGAWNTVQNVKPVYTLKLSGDGNAQANLTISLLPRLKVTLYEAISGRLVVEPYLTAEAGVHGQVRADFVPAGVTTDADYWLTTGQLSGGVDAWLFANVEGCGLSLCKWPNTANEADYSTYHKLNLIGPTPILGIPTLSANMDLSVHHPADSRAILFRGAYSEVANPFKAAFGGPNAFITFGQWTKPKGVALNDSGYRVLDTVAGAADEVWIVFDQPGAYTVRLGGYSSLGGWARQVAEVPVDLTDADHDGMLDWWEQAYGVSDPNADADGDSLSNLAEFQAGTCPVCSGGNNLSITYLGNGGGTVSAIGASLACTGAGCTASVPSGQGLLLTAHASSGSTFGGWGGDCSNDLGAQCRLTMTGAKAVMAIFLAPASKLNDTGITASQCYQAGSDTLVDCGSAGALALNNAQDGMTGRDADPASNSNIDGKLGFSFSAVAGGCVQDNVTGLMWEVKTADGGLRDWHKTYTNYSAAYNPNNQYGAATDASGYVTAVNATSLCGHNDWRLPSADELQSIVDYGVAYPGPTIDATWFPNTQGGWFWSASSYVGYSDYAWGVYFNYGGVNDNNRNVTYAVRLVRAGQ